MLKLCVCAETVFPELKFLERIKKIAMLGYPAIEFWFWDEKDIDQIASLTKELNIEINDIVVNAPDGSIGGSLTKAEDKDKYLERVKETIDIVYRLNCKKLITCSGNIVEHLSYEAQIKSIISTLREATKIVEEEGITLLLEPLNSKVDHPGYFLDSSKIGFDIVKRVNSPHLRLLYDIYHMQIMEGNIMDTIKENLSLIGHFHSAGVPGRNELDLGELNYSNIFRKIGELNYDGCFGLEYFPKKDSEISLREMKEILTGA